MLLILSFLLICFRAIADIYPLCTELVFTPYGILDTETMLYNCSKNIPGNTEPPSTFVNKSGGYSPIQVNVQLSLNNLISVDDIGSQLKIDFFFRLKWVDNRWNFPSSFWNYVNPYTITSDGLSILGYVNNQNQLNVWKPDITFQQVTEMEVVSESFKYYPGNSFYWSRHVVATFTQPAMIYNHFPHDIQNFSLVIQSYAFSSYFITLGYINNQPVTYVDNFQTGTTNLEQNQIWYYKGYTAYIEPVLQPNFANPQRTFSMGFINLEFQRQASGIIVRFVLPLTLLLLLSGLTYWITFENRVDTTITILVSASALYIVILQNVPNVGYLTDADRFIFWMFLLLIAVISSHQIYATLVEKIQRWPMRILILRLIEAAGRIVVPSVIILYFQTTINYFSSVDKNSIIIFVVFGALALSVRESYGIRKSYEKSIRGVFDKINKEDCTISRLSWDEIFILNYLLFKKYSFSVEELAKELSRRHTIEFDFGKEKVYLRNLEQIEEFEKQQRNSSVLSSEKIGKIRESILNSSIELAHLGLRRTGSGQDDGNHSDEKGNESRSSITRNPLMKQSSFSNPLNLFVRTSSATTNATNRSSISSQASSPLTPSTPHPSTITEGENERDSEENP